MKTFKWTIDKQFDFCMGHRVWTQTLDPKYSIDSICACRHHHSHSGILKLFLGSDELINNMVLDFKFLNCYKKLVDEVIDHKFVWDFNDPGHIHELPELYSETLDGLDPKYFDVQEYGYKTIKQSVIDTIKSKYEHTKHKNAIQEKLEGFVFVDFCPTSENLCKWWLEIAEKMLKDLDVNVVAVEYWETPKSHCRYLNPKFA